MYGPTTGPPIRPSRFWYGVAAGLLITALACAAFAVAGFLSLGRQINAFQRVRVPGQAGVTFASPGAYMVYFEGPGFDTIARTGRVIVQLQGADDGSGVQVSQWYGPKETYSWSGRSGIAVASFTIVTPGKYVLSAGLPSSPAPTDVAVGQGLGGGIGTTVILAIVAVFALVFSVVAGAVTGLLRHRSRRALLAGPPVWPGTGPAPPSGFASPSGFVPPPTGFAPPSGFPPSPPAPPPPQS